MVNVLLLPALSDAGQWCCVAFLESSGALQCHHIWNLIGSGGMGAVVDTAGLHELVCIVPYEFLHVLDSILVFCWDTVVVQVHCQREVGMG